MTLFKNSPNLSISDNLYISPQLFALIHSDPFGFSGKKSSNATPPVSKNLNCSDVISPLNSDNLVANRNDNSNLSFSNNDLQIFAYSEYKKYALRFLSLIDKFGDLSDLTMDCVKS